MREFQMLIGGRRISAARRHEVRNPADGTLVGLMPLATDTDLDEAVAAAQEAFLHWSVVPDAERQEACRRIAATIGEHAEELAQLLTREQGKPLNGMGSRFEIAGTQAWTAHTAELVLPVEVLQDDDTGRVELHRKPIGVVGSIPPWNWPVMIACWHLIPAIRAGNTVVIKPSHFTPLSTIRLVELMNEILPPGVVNVVPGDNDLGAAISAHRGIQKIVFTGSTETGRKVMRSGADSLKRLTLELGGNDAGIVLPDVDPKAIAPGLFWGAFINGGQTCAALKRLYVHNSVYDEVCAALVDFARTVKVGNGLDEDSQLGPVQNPAQYAKVRALVEDARQRGGRVLLGGDAPAEGTLFHPITFVADIDHGVRLVDEEQFGPVLPIIRYDDLDEVIARANSDSLGLGGSIWSSDPAGARQHAMRLECGSAWVNKHGAIQPNAPFGGVKSSGLGIEFGVEGLKEFTTVQTVFC